MLYYRPNRFRINHLTRARVVVVMGVVVGGDEDWHLVYNDRRVGSFDSTSHNAAQNPTCTSLCMFMCVFVCVFFFFGPPALEVQPRTISADHNITSFFPFLLNIPSREP